MHQLVGYHRPGTIADALALLSQPDRVALAGGTTIRHDVGGQPREVVDLQDVGLRSVAVRGNTVVIGATADLQTLVDDDRLPELVRRLARAELPSTLRGLATVGGTIAVGESTSVLLAAMLVHDAVVHLYGATGVRRSVPLAELLASGVPAGELITEIELAGSGRGAVAVTGRTPADVPIVAAVARLDGAELRLALTGVAAHPVLVDPDHVAALEPPADPRGSTAYRRHLAGVLTARVVGMFGELG